MHARSLLLSSFLSHLSFFPTVYFPLSSCFSPHFFPFVRFILSSFSAFPSIFLYPILTFLSIRRRNFTLDIRVYTSKSFCSRIEMPCNYKARGKYHLSCDAISSWFIVIALSLVIHRTVNELYRFSAKFCRTP